MMLPDVVPPEFTPAGLTVINRLLAGPAWPGDPELAAFGPELAVAANAFAISWCSEVPSERACVRSVRRTSYSFFSVCPLEGDCPGTG